MLDWNKLTEQEKAVWAAGFAAAAADHPLGNNFTSQAGAPDVCIYRADQCVEKLRRSNSYPWLGHENEQALREYVDSGFGLSGVYDNAVKPLLKNK